MKRGRWRGAGGGGGKVVDNKLVDLEGNEKIF